MSHLNLDLEVRNRLTFRKVRIWKQERGLCTTASLKLEEAIRQGMWSHPEAHCGPWLTTRKEVIINPPGAEFCQEE